LKSNIFEGKSVLLIGGTGTLGNNLLDLIINEEFGKATQINILSRDELKQFDMRKKFKSFNNLNFIIGDIRNPENIKRKILSNDLILNLSALKHVPPYEYNPIEAIKTNTLGVFNITNLISNDTTHSVESFLQISTDKACKPINTYGMSKALAEKITLASNLENTDTNFLVVRYGNVANSRGSFLPLLRKNLLNNETISLTHKDMTRFFMTIEESCYLIIRALEYQLKGSIIIPKLPSFKISDVINIMKEELNSKSEVQITGIRPGEKIHEFLIGREEIENCYQLGNDYVVFSQFLEDPFNTDTFKNFKPFNIPKLEKTTLEKEYSSEYNNSYKAELFRILKVANLL
jgi:UDP-N-acetylglucosamine 4,6-dehydratase/5-epimerase